MLIGVGNVSRRDDGFGPLLARRFEDPAWDCFDAGTAPENYSSLITKKNPKLIVFADASQMALGPGSIRRLPRERLDACGMGTHAMPLSFLVKYLEHALPDSAVEILGVQPSEMGDGEGLSPAMAKALDEACSILKRGALQEVPLWTDVRGASEKGAV